MHTDGPRPEICVGTDEFHTPDWLRDGTITAMRAAAPTGEVGLDSPFWVATCRLISTASIRVFRAVMLEIRRDVVLDHLDALILGATTLIDLIDGRES